MPIIVNYVLVFVDLKGYSQLLEGLMNCVHVEVAQKAHGLVLGVPSQVHLPHAVFKHWTY